ncbi:DUF1435 domain-containing protein, partial [Salmonella enterica subsp. enterica serovar Kentucky]|nr:DUF1435 domain-containing protein [Salmonella enterica subsp. enterica serovar Kentucky]
MLQRTLGSGWGVLLPGVIIVVGICRQNCAKSISLHIMAEIPFIPLFTGITLNMYIEYNFKRC